MKMHVTLGEPSNGIRPPSIWTIIIIISVYKLTYRNRSIAIVSLNVNDGQSPPRQLRVSSLPTAVTWWEVKAPTHLSRPGLDLGSLDPKTGGLPTSPSCLWPNNSLIVFNKRIWMYDWTLVYWGSWGSNEHLYTGAAGDEINILLWNVVTIFSGSNLK